MVKLTDMKMASLEVSEEMIEEAEQKYCSYSRPDGEHCILIEMCGVEDLDELSEYLTVNRSELEYLDILSLYA